MKVIYLIFLFFTINLAFASGNGSNNVFVGYPLSESLNLTDSHSNNNFQFIVQGDTTKKDSLKNKEYNRSSGCNGSNINWGNLNFTGELLPYVAVGILVAGAVIVSNDVTYYRSYSFQDQKIKGQILKFSNTYGHTIGLRKTFEYSAIECYGTQFQSFDAMSLVSPYYKNKKYYNLQFNYTQQIFPKKTSERLKIYAGPSINYLIDFGYGGVAGVEYKIIDRLKLDLRYELTTQSNLVRAGLIFTYQKKSPWEY